MSDSTNKSSERSSEVRLLVLATLCPALYGWLSLVNLVLWSTDIDAPNGITDSLATAMFVPKFFTLPSLVVLTIWAARRIVAGDRRWVVAGSLWSALAVAAVGIVAATHGSIEATVNNAAFVRAYPGSMPPRADVQEIFAQWESWSNPTVAIGRELVALVAMAWVTAAGIRFMPTGRYLSPGAVPFVAMAAVISTYLATHPWSLILDYDFFIGDTVFGGTAGELIFFVAPFDPVGGIVLGAAALVLAAMIGVWSKQDRIAPSSITARSPPSRS